ncbi:hypothetical protein Hanom_Chr05g00402451 [Helianthus anomalus]
MKWQDFKPRGSRCEKTNLWTKVAKLTKPQGRKWHFTLFLCSVKNGSLPPWLQTSRLLQIEASGYYPAKIRSVSTFVRSTQTMTNSS